MKADSFIMLEAATRFELVNNGLPFLILNKRKFIHYASNRKLEYLITTICSHGNLSLTELI